MTRISKLRVGFYNLWGRVVRFINRRRFDVQLTLCKLSVIEKELIFPSFHLSLLTPTDIDIHIAFKMNL